MPLQDLANGLQIYGYALLRPERRRTRPGRASHAGGPGRGRRRRGRGERSKGKGL